MRTKTLNMTFTNCGECPYVTTDEKGFDTCGHAMGKESHLDLDRGIPRWCPLVDAEAIVGTEEVTI